ncbi:MAG TPA: hypothetical protein VKR32_05240 [Puia sp.]|nr:hypothetical protein [Puia sp.]
MKRFINLVFTILVLTGTRWQGVAKIEIKVMANVDAGMPATLDLLKNSVAMSSGLRGAGDISFFAASLNCLDGLGASGGGAHAPGGKRSILSNLQS